MADSKKRKDRGDNNNSNNDQRGPKRSKGGSGGKWKTPHQKVRFARGNGQIEAGDTGIWATCAKNQESRAAEELLGMLEECAQRFYGITDGLGDEDEDDDEGSVEDIEKSIQKELNKRKTTPKLFKHVHLDIPCVMFFKTRPPINPVDFVQRIIQEVVDKPDIRKMRYINRLTPSTLIGKATEKNLDDILQSVLPEHFQLATPEEISEAQAKTGVEVKNKVRAGEGSESKQTTKSGPPSYAIRPSIRAHSNLKRDAVIKQIASSISAEHRVDLTSPDKVILVEIYTAFCGISVVGSDWEKYKRYNLAELYPKPSKPVSSTSAIAEAIPKAIAQSVTTDESPVE